MTDTSALLIVPSLRRCRRLFLRAFEVQLDIGIHEFEKAGKQRLLIDVDLYVPLSDSIPVNDDLSEVVDYDFIRDSIKARIGRGHINLQETLCDDVLNAMLAHPRVVAARVATQKPDVYPDCAGVGVEVFAFKDAAPA